MHAIGYVLKWKGKNTYFPLSDWMMYGGVNTKVILE
jgi:hypothetical protein